MIIVNPKNEQFFKPIDYKVYRGFGWSNCSDYPLAWGTRRWGDKAGEVTDNVGFRLRREK